MVSQTTHPHVSQPSAVGTAPAVVTTHTRAVLLKAGCVLHNQSFTLCIQHAVSLVLCCRFSQKAPRLSHLLFLYCLISWQDDYGAVVTTALTCMT